MSLPFNIAIDGHSSCGKSTIAKVVASKYGMRYIDTGAMYRAVTLGINKSNIRLSDYNKVCDYLKCLIFLSLKTLKVIL